MRTSVRRSRWPRARAMCLIVAMGLIALESDSLRARSVLDVNDPAFVGSVVVALPGAAVPAGATSFQFTSNGVTFRFESLDGVSSLSATNGVPVYQCATADFFNSGFLELTSPTPGVVLVPVDEFGQPIPAPDTGGNRVPRRLLPQRDIVGWRAGHARATCVDRVEVRGTEAYVRRIMSNGTTPITVCTCPLM